MIPMIGGISPANIKIKIIPSYSYRWDEETISGFVDGEMALRQSVFHRLKTERYAYPIYPRSYGIEMEQYKGKTIDYIKADIGETIRECLLQDDRIIDIIINSVEQPLINSLYIDFSIIHNQGSFREQVNFIV